jgi:hypothetical protein
VSQSRTRKIKQSSSQLETQGGDDVFFMDLQEVREVLASKYEYLAERYENKFPKHKGIS